MWSKSVCHTGNWVLHPTIDLKKRFYLSQSCKKKHAIFTQKGHVLHEMNPDFSCCEETVLTTESSCMSATVTMSYFPNFNQFLEFL